MTIRFQVWGERACFRRHEMKVERFSLDVKKLSTARVFGEAIHPRQADCWTDNRIHAFRHVVVQSLRRNEAGVKASESNAVSAMERPTMEGPAIVVDENCRQRSADPGWLLHDIDFADGNESRFFRAKMRAGVIEVPPFHSQEVGL